MPLVGGDSPSAHQDVPPVGILSDSSSDSDSSSGSSGSDSESEAEAPVKENGRGFTGSVNGAKSSQVPLSMPDNLLNDDLQLSETGSESD